MMLAREQITDALRFWELGRVPYNLVLLLVVIAAVWFGGDWRILFQLGPALVVLAVAANVAYCVAYPIDLFVQASEYREAWKSVRWLLWLAGTALAALLAAVAMLGVQPLGF